MALLKNILTKSLKFSILNQITIPATSSQIRQNSTDHQTRITGQREAAIATRRKTLRHFRQEDITQFAVKKIERLPTYSLNGRWPPNEQQLIQTAEWLHKNIPVRVAHIIYRFRRLPFEIGCNEHIQEAHEQYIKSFNRLREIQTIRERTERETWKNVLELTELLDTLLLDHQKVLPLLVTGFRETAKKFDKNSIMSKADIEVVSAETREHPHQKSQRFLDTILKERLCIRLLCDHHVKVLKRYQKEQAEGESNSKNSENGKNGKNGKNGQNGKNGKNGENGQNNQNHQSNNQTWTPNGQKIKKNQHVGIFNRQFDPCELVEQVYTELEDVCNAQYGMCPKFSIKFKDNFTETGEENNLFGSEKNYGYDHGFKTQMSTSRNQHKLSTFKYISWPLEYILKEIIKNAMRAQVKTQIDERTLEPVPGAKQYPIKILVVQNEEGFDIRISDRGGGIKTSSLENIWEYNFSSVDGNEEDEDFYSMVNTQGDTKKMFGYGCGLPISKVYCETLGGELSLQSINSYGTDVFIKLPFLPNATVAGKGKLNNNNNKMKKKIVAKPILL